MTDQCKHCTSRGDLDLCKKTPCFHHENWYAVEQQKVIDNLISAVEAYMDCIDDYMCGDGFKSCVFEYKESLQQAIKKAKG